LHIVAGNGGFGFANGIGSSAQFERIMSLAYHSELDVLYACEQRRIRKIVVAARSVRDLFFPGLQCPAF